MQYMSHVNPVDEILGSRAPPMRNTVTRYSFLFFFCVLLLAGPDHVRLTINGSDVNGGGRGHTQEKAPLISDAIIMLVLFS